MGLAIKGLFWVAFGQESREISQKITIEFSFVNAGTKKSVSTILR